MGLFRRKKGDDQPVDMNERSPELGIKYKDLMLLDSLVKHGADLTEPRHVIYYLYAPNQTTAQEIGHEAEARGYKVNVREPHPDFPSQWPVVCETLAVTSPDHVRDADDFFQGLADRHDGEFDGWEASAHGHAA